ncbi:hypothetical protein MMC15_007259 [Xylographa vitiligo]|nr:hypothetical protein [Xylographa vitiligo]
MSPKLPVTQVHPTKERLLTSVTCTKVLRPRLLPLTASAQESSTRHAASTRKPMSASPELSSIELPFSIYSQPPTQYRNEECHPASYTLQHVLSTLTSLPHASLPNTAARTSTPQALYATITKITTRSSKFPITPPLPPSKSASFLTYPLITISDPHPRYPQPKTKPPHSSNRQFYHLSRLHHPDHNPNDPTASTRFVAISTAYAVLGSPSARSQYDREHLPSSSAASHHPNRQGSHSSASAPFGARPASGLSKRRTRFHGPPPSFYRSGGWGAQGAKRAAGQESSASGSGTQTGEGNSGYAFRGGSAAGAGETSGAAGRDGAGASTAAGGGFSPGQGPHGWAAWSDVPHFDREGHLWTQERQEMRRKRRMEGEGAQSDARGPGILFNFLLISGVVGFASLVTAAWREGVGLGEGERRKKD